VTRFATLASESVRDAVRRRIVPVIVVLSVLSLVVVDSCTRCDANVMVQGQSKNLANLSAWPGLALCLALGAWMVILAGILASDHLAEGLEDGSAALVLSRPVSRTEYVAARLAGTLAVALTTGAVWIGVAAALLHARQELAMQPAVTAWLASALAAISVAAFAMTLSLVLPRTATVLIVFATVIGIAFVNLLAAFGMELDGAARIVNELGPPMAVGILDALSSWVDGAGFSGSTPLLWLRALAWDAVAAAMLTVAFRRVEIGR